MFDCSGEISFIFILSHSSVLKCNSLPLRVSEWITSLQTDGLDLTIDFRGLKKAEFPRLEIEDHDLAKTPHTVFSLQSYQTL